MKTHFGRNKQFTTSFFSFLSYSGDRVQTTRRPLNRRGFKQNISTISSNPV